MKNNHSLVKAEWLFFYLLKIITNAIIKVIAMIVSPTNPNVSIYIICNKVSIAPPRFLTGKLCSIKVAMHSAYLKFYVR